MRHGCRAAEKGKNMSNANVRTVDVAIENHGSIFVFSLNTDDAREWVEEFVDVPSHMRPSGSTLHVEHGHAETLAAGMAAAGLTVA